MSTGPPRLCRARCLDGSGCPHCVGCMGPDRFSCRCMGAMRLSAIPWLHAWQVCAVPLNHGLAEIDVNLTDQIISVATSPPVSCRFRCDANHRGSRAESGIRSRQRAQTSVEQQWRQKKAPPIGGAWEVVSNARRFSRRSRRRRRSSPRERPQLCWPGTRQTRHHRSHPARSRWQIRPNPLW